MIRISYVFFASAFLTFVYQTQADPVNKRTRKARDDGPEDFVQAALDAHNQYRGLHQAPLLTVAQDLNDFSQDWANHLAEQDTYMQHSNLAINGHVGENMYLYVNNIDPSAEPKAHDVVKGWYDEIENYNFDTHYSSMPTGHFTQVVWKSTNEMGIGKAKSSSGRWFVVANYRPAGNIWGQFKSNVLPKNPQT